MESRGFIPHYTWQEGNARGSLPFCAHVNRSPDVYEKQSPACWQGGYRGEEKSRQSETETSTSSTDIMEEEKTSDEKQGKAAGHRIIEVEM
jgi:hypothetical protein